MVRHGKRLMQRVQSFYIKCDIWGYLTGKFSRYEGSKHFPIISMVKVGLREGKALGSEEGRVVVTSRRK
jgi:hypothetical protein